jgi:hypothetical protein
MKFYGENVLTNPATGRVWWDFVDGPLDTEDPAQIAEARRLGLSEKPTSMVKATKVEKLLYDKEALVSRAADLKIDSPSTLKRWSAEKLQAEIAKAEAAVEAE